MNNPLIGSPGTWSAAQLRDDFDRSFAHAPQETAAAMDDYLAIRLGNDPHALRLTEIASLAPLATTTRVPSPCAELLGLIGFRGRLTPVYDLRTLLGYAAPTLPRWRVVAASGGVALAFDGFEGHLRVPRHAAAAASEVQEQPRRHVRAVLHSGQADMQPIVSIESVLEAIRALARPSAREPGI